MRLSFAPPLLCLFLPMAVLCADGDGHAAAGPPPPPRSGSVVGLDAASLATGAALVVTIFLASLALFAADVYLTSKLDQMLLDHYGPEIYDQFTSKFSGGDEDDPDSPVGLTATTREDFYGQDLEPFGSPKGWNRGQQTQAGILQYGQSLSHPVFSGPGFKSHFTTAHQGGHQNFYGRAMPKTIVGLGQKLRLLLGPIKGALGL